MKQEFINKVISEINNNWENNYEAMEKKGLIIVYFNGQEVAFIKDYKADSETEGNEQEVEQLQYYCDKF